MQKKGLVVYNRLDSLENNIKAKIIKGVGKMSVFITDGTWSVTQSAIRSLGWNNIRVVAGDTSRFIFGLHSIYCSKFVIYPSPKTEAFITNLYNIIRDLEIDVLIPMSNDTTFQISKHKDIFEKITTVPIPDHEIMMKAFDKLETVKSAQKLGLPTPKTYFINNEPDLEKLSEVARFPLILKPRIGGGASVGLFLATTPKEFILAYKTIIKNFGEPIIQEYIPGNSEQMHMVNVLFNKKSKPVVSFTAKKLREYPITGGITTFGESTWSSEIAELSIKLLKDWNWYGVAEVEFKKDSRDNTYKIIEVNPRFWQYLQLPIYCGVDFPYLLYKVALDENTKQITDYEIGTKFINPIKDPLSVLQNLKNSQNTKKDIYTIFKSYKGRKTYLLLSKSDPLPVIGKFIQIIQNNIKHLL